MTYAVFTTSPVESSDGSGWKPETALVGTYRWAMTAWLVAYWTRAFRLHPLGVVRVMKRDWRPSSPYR